MLNYSVILFILAILQISCTTTPSTNSQPIDTLFGIRIGQTLESQFGECPKNEEGAYNAGFHKGTTPCWTKTDTYKEVKLPSSLLAETKALIDSTAKITLEDNIVVEIELFAHQSTWQKLEQYMLEYYGSPLEIETYERDSRVSGISESRILTWRANGITLYFTERASNDSARIRVFSDAWVTREAQRNKAM